MESELTSLLREEAEQEKSRILHEAREEADALLGRVNEETGAQLKKAEQEVALWMKKEKEKIRNSLNLQLSSSLLKEKSVWIQKVFAETREKLEGYRLSPDYQVIMELLLEEVLSGKPAAGETLILVHPEDQDLLKNLLKRKKIEAKIRTDPSIKVGLKLITEEGKVEISNTLPDRLSRAEPRLVVKLRKILWGK